MSRPIVMERVFAYPPERLWRALTDSSALADWLMENDFQPVLHHEFTFRTKPAPGFDGIVRCRVIELDEPSAWPTRGAAAATTPSSHGRSNPSPKGLASAWSTPASRA